MDWQARMRRHRTTRFLLIRHGQTESNVRRAWQGVREDPLTARGCHEARCLGDWLARHDRPLALYASPLSRARDTAELIAKAVHGSVVIDARVREMDFGSCSGLTWVQIGERFPDLPLVRQPWREAYAPTVPDWQWPDGEWHRPYHHAIRDALAEIAERHPGETVAVVTHGGFILGALAWLLHGITGRAHREYEIPNASVTEVGYSADGYAVAQIGVQPWPPHDDHRNDPIVSAHTPWPHGEESRPVARDGETKGGLGANTIDARSTRRGRLAERRVGPPG